MPNFSRSTRACSVLRLISRKPQTSSRRYVEGESKWRNSWRVLFKQLRLCCWLLTVQKSFLPSHPTLSSTANHNPTEMTGGDYSNHSVEGIEGKYWFFNSQTLLIRLIDLLCLVSGRCHSDRTIWRKYRWGLYCSVWVTPIDLISCLWVLERNWP